MVDRFSPTPKNQPITMLLLHSTRRHIPLLFHKTLSSPKSSVAVFWDLNNKPPNSISPYDAAIRLRLSASSFGPFLYTVAYANHHAFRHKNSGPLSPSVPYVCRVCSRNFYNHTKLLNHFHQIHNKEQAKRLNRLESARGARRVNLAARLSMKMAKYKRAETDLLIPNVGYGMADELRRAGVWVRTVKDLPDEADRALRDHMVDAMNSGGIGCLVLVSNDLGFERVMREARVRCLKTVVVGDEVDGALKRCADAGFSWRDVVSGKARKEAGSAVGRWKDRELLKRLEWRYETESEESDGGCRDGTESGPWWKMD